MKIMSMNKTFCLLVVVANLFLLSLEFSYASECDLILSGALDDHYVSQGDYLIVIYIDGEKVYGAKKAPFEHGKPYGKRFNNWKNLTVQIPKHTMRDGIIKIQMTHSGSTAKDWIAIDHLQVVCPEGYKKVDLYGYKNYGVKDGAADIIYGGDGHTWIIELNK